MRLNKYDIECLKEAKNFIDKNIANHYTIPEIAHHVGFSPTRLKAAFKQHFGMGLYKYLQQQRLERGRYLLENTDYTLKYISRLLGYKYKNNFSTAFKKKYGKPPGSLKK